MFFFSRYLLEAVFFLKSLFYVGEITFVWIKKETQINKVKLAHVKSHIICFNSSHRILTDTLAAYDNEIQLLRSTTEDLEYKLQEKAKLELELNEMKQSFFIGDSKDSVR